VRAYMLPKEPEANTDRFAPTASPHY
jgi:hypothetical protein